MGGRTAQTRLLAACCTCLMAGALVAADKIDPAQADFFEKRVRPLLVHRCLDCHQGSDAENGLSMNSLSGLLEGGLRGPAIVPGKAEQSLLIRALRHGELLKMPPKSKLPAAEIAVIAKWIADGAVWPHSDAVTASPRKSRTAKPVTFTAQEKSFWAFRKPESRRLPIPPAGAALQSPIDTFLRAKRDAAGLHSAPPADKYTLIRRATLALTGLPPTADQTAAFLADDRPDAFVRLVERLLASPRYGERWGRHWLDVIRYADSNGLDENLAYANAFRYRDYVIAAFNANKSYARFVQEQIAGDLLADDGSPNNTFDRFVATGFLSIGPKMLAEDDPLKLRMDIIDEQVDTIGRTFMGLTLGCARCHDHKFDPIPTHDYYALAGIFNSTKTMDSYKVVAQWREQPLATPEAIARRDAHQKRSKQLADQISQRRSQADQAVQDDARRHVGDYLLAAETSRRRAALLAGLKPLGGADGIGQRAGVVLREAENFDRGNVLKDTTQYGKQIGVLVNRGEKPNFAEYDITLPQGGMFRLEVRYAAAAARPCKLLVNGTTLRSDIADGVTGSWYPDTQRWDIEGFVQLAAGKNTLRLEHPMFFPHIDQWLLIPATANELPRLEMLDTTYRPLPEFVSAWVAALKTNDSKKTGLGAWSEAVKAAAPPMTLRKLARTYQATINATLDRRTAAAASESSPKPSPQAALVQFVTAAEGPFRSPGSLDQHFPEPVRKELRDLMQRKTELDKSMPQFPQAMAVADDDVRDLRLHYRGSHLTQGPVVARGFLRILTGPQPKTIPDAHSGRLELANWMTSPEHPLTARVFVNRVWHWHFGKGLVRSPDNFGRLGERPTHPELLDWLARRFIESGWDVKQLHRLIMQSATWQMSNRWDARAAAADPENRLWWRRDHKRLEAEAIRDGILHVTGTLDQTMAGSLLPTANRKYVTSTANVDPVTYMTDRRSVYIPVVRSALYDVFQAFDFADPSALSGSRQSTTVAPQALFMMNSRFVSQRTQHAATQLLAQDQLDDSARVVRCYQQIYARMPTDDERRRALQFVQRYSAAFAGAGSEDPQLSRVRGWQSLFRVLIAANEFVYVN